MNNAVKPEYAPCEPDFAVNVDSPLAKLMCSLSAEDVKANKKMLVESLNILSACYLTHLFPFGMMHHSFEELYEVGFQLRKAYPEFRAIPWKEAYDDYAVFNYCRFY